MVRCITVVRECNSSLLNQVYFDYTFQIREIELKQQVRSLEQTIKELELHIETVVRERNHSEDKLKNLRDVKQREFQVC